MQSFVSDVTNKTEYVSGYLSLKLSPLFVGIIKRGYAYLHIPGLCATQISMAEITDSFLRCQRTKGT